MRTALTDLDTVTTLVECPACYGVGYTEDDNCDLCDTDGYTYKWAAEQWEDAADHF